MDIRTTRTRSCGTWNHFLYIWKCDSSKETYLVCRFAFDFEVKIFRDAKADTKPPSKTRSPHPFSALYVFERIFSPELSTFRHINIGPRNGKIHTNKCFCSAFKFFVLIHSGKKPVHLQRAWRRWTIYASMLLQQVYVELSKVARKMFYFCVTARFRTVLSCCWLKGFVM